MKRKKEDSTTFFSYLEKKMLFRPLHTFLILFISTSISAQMYFDQGRQISGTDSVHFANSNALIVNPAYLGHSRKLPLDIRLLQVGFNAHSDALDRYYVNRLTFSNEDIAEEDKQEILEFAPERLDLDSRASIEWLGVSFNTPSLGGLSVSVHEEANGTMYLDEALTELFLEGLEAEWLEGQGDSTVVLPASVDGSEMYYQHLRTVQIGYGRSIVSMDGFELFGGVKIARVWGMGYLDVSFRENIFHGQSSFSRFYNINYGDLEDFGDVEVAIHDRGRADLVGLVDHLDVGRLGVGFAVDADGMDAEAVAGAGDATGDFTAIGNEYAIVHV